MPIHQVTHINHVQAENAPPVEPSGTLAALAGAEQRLGQHKYFVRNPKLLNDAAKAFQRTMESGRNGLDRAGREAQADMWKIGSNVVLKDGKTHAALIGYVVGIWYLRPGQPPCPMLVAQKVASAQDGEAEFNCKGVDELAAWLQIGSESQAEDGAPAPDSTAQVGSAIPAGAGESSQAEAGPVEDDEVSAAAPSAELPNGSAALRTSLHLNVAAAALKLSAWAVAKAACEKVLSMEEGNPKALFRLAKALEGEGDLKPAIAALVALIKKDVKNREARQLLDVLKQRQADEKSKFKGLFAPEAPPTRPPTFEEAYEAHLKERERLAAEGRVYDKEDLEYRQRLYEKAWPTAPAPAPTEADSTAAAPAPVDITEGVAS